MNKAVLTAIFSLLAFTPLSNALAQTGSSGPAVKALDRSSAGISSTTDDPKLQNQGSDAVVGNASAKNSIDASKTTEPTDSTSSAPTKTELEAQKNYNTGVALYESGKLDEAIDALKEANKLKPNDPQTQYMMGMVYWKSKDYSDAADSFKRAVKLKPDWPEANFKLGVAAYVLGRKGQSSEAYKKLLELNSPLANTLYRINTDASSANLGEKEKTDLASSNTKQVEIVPVSAPAVSAPSNERSRPSVGDSNGTSNTEAASSNKATAKLSNERPSPSVSDSNGTSNTEAASSNKATAKLSNERPSPSVSDSNSKSSPVAPPHEPTPTRTASAEAVLPNNAAVTSVSALTEIYRVGVGDVLDIRMLNSTTNRSTLYSVAEGGLIDLPIAGAPLAVAGLTTREIQARIKSEMKRLAVEDADVAVAVRQYGSHSVIITGLVASPGVKILRREAVPLYVILAEVQPRLDAARVSIMRAGVTGQLLDLGESEALNFVVRPGDVINVTARPPDFYYISGRINYPGQKPFQPGITLVQAILAAGGLARDNSVELSREGADGRLATTKFNLKEIKTGKIQDPRLQPGDRIEVFH
jgi:protein involved in polysaccharide export with SLBB domain/tetratricopeptide (TPR) repeat protein